MNYFSLEKSSVAKRDSIILITYILLVRNNGCQVAIYFIPIMCYYFSNLCPANRAYFFNELCSLGLENSSLKSRQPTTPDSRQLRMKASEALATAIIQPEPHPFHPPYKNILLFKGGPCGILKESFAVPRTEYMTHIQRFRALDEQSHWLKTDFTEVGYNSPDQESEEGKSQGFIFDVEVTQLDMWRTAAPKLKENSSTARECADVMLALNMLFSPVQVALFLKECMVHRLAESMFQNERPNVFPVIIGCEYRLAVVKYNSALKHFDMKFSSISQGRGYHPGARFHVKNPFSKKDYSALLKTKS